MAALAAVGLRHDQGLRVSAHPETLVVLQESSFTSMLQLHENQVDDFLLDQPSAVVNSKVG